MVRPYAQIAAQYVDDILSGAIPACKWVRLAAQRQRDDLAKQADPSYPFAYDEEKGIKKCRVIELCPHIEGPLAGQRIVLAPWQVFILMTVFSWVKKATGTRRFRRIYIEVPRGNGKSCFSAPVAISMLAADDEGGPQVYSAARTKEQARIVFDTAKKMLRTEEGSKLRKALGLQILEHSILHPKTNGKFLALASEADSLDGLNVHFGCIDELHAHPNSEVYDVLDTATGKRTQSMLWMITTAGTDIAGICYITREYVTQILEHIFEDDAWFGVVYTIDEGDEWSDPASWAKANPNYGVSVYADDLENKARKAANQKTSLVNFKTKHLDVWQPAGMAWMDMQRLRACINTALKEEDFAGKQCVVGVDLASKLDICSMVRLYWDTRDDGRRLYTAFWSHWVPKARVDTGDNASYEQWAAKGILQVCDGATGETNDIGLVENAIREAAKGDVREVAHDPWGAIELVNTLANEGLELVQVDQNTRNLSPSCKEIEAAIFDGRFQYNGDPVATWAFSNVVVKVDKNDNIFPFKTKPENKIDPVVALATATIRVLHIDGQGVSSADQVGKCAKCTEFVVGELINGQLTFLCERHKSA